MGKEYTPLFDNATGASEIAIGARHFGCSGAPKPMDHPYVYMEIASGGSVDCPYCSTRYRHDPELAEDESRPVD